MQPVMWSSLQGRETNNVNISNELDFSEMYWGKTAVGRVQSEWPTAAIPQWISKKNKIYFLNG